MRNLICALAVMTLLLVVGVVTRTVGAADDAPATIDKIMETLHKGRKSPLAALKTALRNPSPDWSSVQKETKTYAKYAADLPKNDPPKGDAAGFKKLAKNFAGYAKALDDAAGKEDLAAAKTAFGKIGGSCKSCHDTYKED
jgi:cytochrome c556